MSKTVQRITDYLFGGGLFNPELAIHGEVRNLLIDCRDELTAAKEKIAEQEAPIPMLLFCPRCEHQHIDAPEPETGWTNPPHATHTCKRCGLNWRPSNHLTTGVAEIECLEPKHAERIAAARPSAEAQIKALLQDAKRYKAWQRYWFDGEGDELNEAINSAETPEEMDAVLDRQAVIDAARKK